MVAPRLIAQSSTARSHRAASRWPTCMVAGGGQPPRPSRQLRPDTRLGHAHCSASRGPGGGEDGGAGAGGGSAQAPTPPLGRMPTARDGVDWFCCAALWALFLVDLTPAGRALASAGALEIAAFQATAFLLPTVVWALRRGFDLRKTFGLWVAPAPAWLAAGATLGPAVWLLTAGAVSLKTGVWPWDSAAAASAAASPSVLGGLVASAAGGGAAPQALTALFGGAALVPAVTEELLFRGLLLTALRQRLGRVDAAAVAAALFAAMHLSVEQFFPLCLLGFATGGAAVASGSVWPAVVLHFFYNATGLALGLSLAGLGAG